MNELEHYGIPRKSGRYKWGSGKNPYHHGLASPLRRKKYNALEKRSRSALQQASWQKSAAKQSSRIGNYKHAALLDNNAKRLGAKSRHYKELVKIDKQIDSSNGHDKKTFKAMKAAGKAHYKAYDKALLADRERIRLDDANAKLRDAEQERDTDRRVQRGRVKSAKYDKIAAKNAKAHLKYQKRVAAGKDVSSRLARKEAKYNTAKTRSEIAYKAEAKYNARIAKLKNRQEKAERRYNAAEERAGKAYKKYYKYAGTNDYTALHSPNTDVKDKYLKYRSYAGRTKRI